MRLLCVMLVISAFIGCNQISGIADLQFGLVDDGGDDDDDDSNDDDDDPTDTGQEPVERPTDVIGGDLAYMEFCHDLSRETGGDYEDIILTLELSNNEWSAVYHAATWCCTPCGYVPANTQLHLKLEDAVVSQNYETNYTFEIDNEYFVVAEPVVGGLGISLSNLTEKDQGQQCETYLPPGYSKCGGPIDTDSD